MTMASTVRGLKPNMSSKFYGDEDQSQQPDGNSMEEKDSFYKQAAHEVLRDAAKIRSNEMTQPENPQEEPAQQEQQQQQAPEAHVEEPAVQAVTDDSGFDDFDFVEAYDDVPSGGSDDR